MGSIKDSFMTKKIHYYKWPLLSGFFIGTSYIPFYPWALFFCLTPLWLFWIRESSYKKIFLGGWVTQFFLNLIGFHWISHTVVEFGRLPLFMGLGALFLFCAFGHLYYPLAGVLWKWLSNKFNLSQTASLILLPLVFVLCERLYPFIFYWHLGYPWLWAKFPGFHLAQWIGFFGLNLITLFINSFLCLAWIQWIHQKNRNRSLAFGSLALSAFLILNGIGFIISKKIKEPDRSLRVLVVQGNIGNFEKIQSKVGHRYMKSVVQTHANLTLQGFEQSKGRTIDLVIWPETAFPETLRKGFIGQHQKTLAKLSTKLNVPFLIGAFQEEDGKIFNSLVLMDGVDILGSYQKTMLLPFGEYIPFGKYFPGLKKMLPMISDFTHGTGPSILEHPKALIGSQICYEGLFDEFSTQLQKKKAQIFVNVTNDSWFGQTFEPYQHMHMTLARAIENRRPLIRVTNTGISTVILSDGKILEYSPLNEEWFKIFDVPYHSTPPSTFYMKLSENWIWILFLLIGSVILGDRLAGSNKGRTSSHDHSRGVRDPNQV